MTIQKNTKRDHKDNLRYSYSDRNIRRHYKVNLDKPLIEYSYADFSIDCIVTLGECIVGKCVEYAKEELYSMTVIFKNNPKIIDKLTFLESSGMYVCCTLDTVDNEEIYLNVQIKSIECDKKANIIVVYLIGIPNGY